MACLIPCWGSSQWVIYCTLVARSSPGTSCWLRLLVSFPILGADFLEKFNLLVDLCGSQLIDGDTGRKFHLSSLAASGVFASIGVANTMVATSSSTPSSSTPSSSTPSALHQRLITAVAVDYSTILAEFPELLNVSKQLQAVKHDVVHHIETEGRPSTAKYRRC